LLENEWLTGEINCQSYKTTDGDGSLVIVGNTITSGRIYDVSTDQAYIAGNKLLDGSITARSYCWIVGNSVLYTNTSNGIHTEGSYSHIIANRVRCTYNDSCILSESPFSYIAANIIETHIAINSSEQTGIEAAGGHSVVVNNVVRGIYSTETRTGSAIYVTSPVARVSGNIIIDYFSITATPIDVTSIDSEVTNNLCYNNSGDCPDGGENLDADPLFADTDNYMLQLGSPAIDAGPPDYSMADLDRSRNDMGVHGGPWSIGQYDIQRDPNNYAPYVYPLIKIESYLSGGILEIQALGVARIR